MALCGLVGVQADGPWHLGCTQKTALLHMARRHGAGETDIGNLPGALSVRLCAPGRLCGAVMWGYRFGGGVVI